MNKKHYSKAIFFIAIISMLLVLVSDCIAQDEVSVPQETMFKLVSLDMDKMFVSYGGAAKERQNDSQPKQADDYLTIEDTDTNGYLVRITSKDEFSQVKESVIVIARQVMKYFSFDSENKEASPFQMENLMTPSRDEGKPFDFQLSFGIGYEKEARNLSLNTIKVSAYGFSTCVDAVYDYNNQGVDLFLSNTHINTLLADGMKLELQISSAKNSAGALVLTTPF